MRRHHTSTVIAALVCGALLLGACGSSSPSASSGAGTSTSYPVTLRGANGAVVIAQRPTRIMSLSASATSMLYAIGAGRQVVAVDQYSTDPPNAPRTSLTGFETGAESYLSYRPDLVVLAQEQGSVVSQLAAVGVPTLVLSPASGLGDTYAQISLLGRATGHGAAATAENASIKRKLAAIVRSVGGRARGVTYYHELDPTLYSATSHTFIGVLYRSLGMVNVADTASAGGNDYPQLSPEALIRANPDDVFLADVTCCAQTAATFGARPGFSLVQAVRAHHVFTIPDSIASEWGPRVVQFLQMVADDLKAAGQ